MSDELDPPGRELEALYESLRSDALDGAALARVEANLGPLLDPSGGSSGGSASSGFSAKLFVMPGAVLGVATLAMLSLVVSESRPRTRDEAPAGASASREDTPTVPAERVSSPPEPRAEEPAAEARVERAEPSRDPIEPSFDEGAELLRRARTSLASDPSATLALTEQHRRRFPRGMLTLERELVAIDALVALGRRADARARGGSLLEADPENARVLRKLAQHGLESEAGGAAER